VIDATPEHVCAGDGFATEIVISGARSAVRLSLVPAAPEPGELEYAWRLEGSEHLIVAGALGERELRVRMAADRPLHATLRVTDDEGGEAEARRTIGITFPVAPPCGDGCPAGSSCVDLGGEDGCIADSPCASDADCGRCFVCDVVLARCAPPREP
jgi:hypothetical protein